MPVETFIYFGYGSNMPTARLQKRCPNARPIRTAIALGYFLGFCKRSNDCSGKATLGRTEGLQHEGRGVLGVTFEIPRDELTNLDVAEGKGYDRCDTFEVVCLSDGNSITTTAYLASPNACDQSLVPYDWYRALILAGALEHKLPDSYIAGLRSVSVQSDPKPNRETRQEALRVLKYSGFKSLLDECE